MIRSRFLWKLYAGYAVVVLISTITIGILLVHQVQADARLGSIYLLRAQAALLRGMVSPELKPEEITQLQQAIVRLRSESDVRLTILSADGTVVADSDEEPGQMDNHLDRPEIQAAATQAEGISTRRSDTLDKNMMYVALRIGSASNIKGYVRASFSTMVIEQGLERLERMVVLSAGIAAMLALALGFFFARRVTSRLERITQAVRGIAEGRPVATIAVESKDEIGILAEAFNTMSTQLQETIGTITSNRNKLTAILGSMVEGVVAVDREERILHLNLAARKILKVGPEECVGRKIWEVSRTQEVNEALESALKEGQDALKEVTLVGRPHDITIKIHATPLMDSEHALTGAVVLLQDVTGLRRLETVRRDFVANVSHELKTPLTAVRGLVETMLDDADMELSMRERFLGKIHRQAMRLSSLVTDLLTLSRVDQEHADLERVALDLCVPVRESLNSLTSSAEAKQITLNVSIPDGPVNMLGDSEAMRQAVDNLLDNAIKYTPKGGSVFLRMQRNDDAVVIEVEDSGPGIEPVHQDRVFERFYRVDKARSRALGGTGLGLSIVKHIAQAHDGEVSLESIPGKGCTFRICLSSVAQVAG